MDFDKTKNNASNENEEPQKDHKEIMLDHIENFDNINSCNICPFYNRKDGQNYYCVSFVDKPYHPHEKRETHNFIEYIKRAVENEENDTVKNMLRGLLSGSKEPVSDNKEDVKEAVFDNKENVEEHVECCEEPVECCEEPVFDNKENVEENVECCEEPDDFQQTLDDFKEFKFNYSVALEKKWNKINNKLKYKSCFNVFGFFGKNNKKGIKNEARNLAANMSYCDFYSIPVGYWSAFNINMKLKPPSISKCDKEMNEVMKYNYKLKEKNDKKFLDRVLKSKDASAEEVKEYKKKLKNNELPSYEASKEKLGGSKMIEVTVENDDVPVGNVIVVEDTEAEAEAEAEVTVSNGVTISNEVNEGEAEVKEFDVKENNEEA